VAHNSDHVHHEEDSRRVMANAVSWAGHAKHLGVHWSWGRTILAASVLYLLTGVYSISADQVGVILVFERVSWARAEPGLHWTWPFPFSRVEKVKVMETKRLTVGVDAPDRVLGRAGDRTKAQFLTGDQNIINVRLAVQYAIKDAVEYLFVSKDVAALIAGVVESSLSDVVVRRQVDDLLTTEKVAVQQQVQADAQALLDCYRCGVYISNISIESVSPPAEVLDAFRDVASAREDRERIMREAESYSNNVVPRARGEASRLGLEAQGYFQSSVSEAKGDASRFASLAGEYAHAKEVTSQRLFLETMEEVLPRLKKIIVEGNVDLDLIQKKN
jgi:modulator of FtsH protease HflK